MFKRMLPIVAVLFLPALAQTNANNQPAKKPPTIVVRLASLDNFLENLKALGGLVGSDELGKTIDDAIKQKLGAKGLDGIDGKKPVGLYLSVGADISDLSGVVMVPITGETKFKEMLDALGWEVGADKGGLRTVKQNLLPVDVQYRVANGYAYFGLVGQDTLAPAALITPEALFGAKPQAAAISLTVRLDQVPKDVRDLLIDAVKDGFGKVDDKAAESKAQKAMRGALTKEFSGLLERVFTDGEELNALIDIDQKAKQISIDATMTAKARSKLADKVAKLAPRRTLFAGVLDKEAAINGLINFELSAEVRNALKDVVQEVFDNVLTGLKDDGKKKQASDLLEALKPSLNAETIDAGFSLRGPNKSKHFTLVAGIKLKQGEKLAATLLAMTKDLPEKDRNAIKLNADSAGGAAIHQIDLQASFDAATKEAFGEHPLFIAFRDDAVFLAIGEGGLAALKKALQTPATEAPPLQFDLSLARFATTSENLAKATSGDMLLWAGEDPRVRFSLEGGQTWRVRFTMDFSALHLSNKGK